MASRNVRLPAVAGKFYPSSQQELRKEIARFVHGAPEQQKTNAVACMVPHAGYMYSGLVAGETLASVVIKKRIILLGPNHTGYGEAFSIMSQGQWQTPLGNVKIDEELAGAILSKSKYLKHDTRAHEYEHCLEVEVPFLQYLKEDVRIVPLVFSSNDVGVLRHIGDAIAEAVAESAEPESVLLVASTDMTHYESQSEAEKKDKEALQAILKLDEEELAQRINTFHISMCGYAPVIVMLAAAKRLGAKAAKLIKYQTSAAETGDTTSVVGYAGVIVY